MYNFDEKSYRKEAELTYETRTEIEQIADTISKEGFSNIFFIASGGSLAIMNPVHYVLKQRTAIPVYLEVAAEVIHTGNKELTKDSLVITASKSGTTKETVAVTKWCIEQGIRVFALCGKMDSPLSQLATYSVIGKAKDAPEFEYMQLFMFTMRLLHNNCEFPDYNRFADQLATLPKDLIRFRDEFEPQAMKIAEVCHKEPYQMWIGGGSIWGEIYSFTMCVLEEMQWNRTKAVTSAEFFHGTLELVEKDTPVVLVKNDDNTRMLDERVENFLPKVCDKYFVIDLHDFRFSQIDDQFRAILMAPICSAIIGDCLSAHYEKCSGHSLDIRRYYRQMEY